MYFADATNPSDMSLLSDMHDCESESESDGAVEGAVEVEDQRLCIKCRRFCESAKDDERLECIVRETLQGRQSGFDKSVDTRVRREQGMDALVLLLQEASFDELLSILGSVTSSSRPLAEHVLLEAVRGSVPRSLFLASVSTFTTTEEAVADASKLLVSQTSTTFNAHYEAFKKYKCGLPHPAGYRISLVALASRVLLRSMDTDSAARVIFRVFVTLSAEQCAVLAWDALWSTRFHAQYNSSLWLSS